MAEDKKRLETEALLSTIQGMDDFLHNLTEIDWLNNDADKEELATFRDGLLKVLGEKTLEAVPSEMRALEKQWQLAQANKKPIMTSAERTENEQIIRESRKVWKKLCDEYRANIKSFLEANPDIAKYLRDNLNKIGPLDEKYRIYQIVKNTLEKNTPKQIIFEETHKALERHFPSSSPAKSRKY